MSMSPTARASSTSVGASAAFWERLWRLSGVNFIAFFVIAYLVYGTQPLMGASADELVAFYGGERTRIMIAAVFSGMAVLNLMWFAAALRSTLTDAGQDGSGGAATAASAAVGGVFLLLIATVAAPAYSIAGSGDHAFLSGLNDFGWAAVVMSTFPRAMLIMSGSLGLWRLGLISNSLFAAGVAAIVLVLLGGTTWVHGGLWAPDGAYSRFISPIIGLVWVAVVSRVLLSRSPATRSGW